MRHLDRRAGATPAITAIVLELEAATVTPALQSSQPSISHYHLLLHHNRTSFTAKYSLTTTVAAGLRNESSTGVQQFLRERYDNRSTYLRYAPDHGNLSVGNCDWMEHRGNMRETPVKKAIDLILARLNQTVAQSRCNRERGQVVAPGSLRQSRRSLEEVSCVCCGG